jgi:hypothetical protein
VLPNDKNKELAFQVTLTIRLYADTRQNFAGQRRRLMYRDTSVPLLRQLSAVSDLELATDPCFVQIPENIEVFKDGSITVYNVSSVSSATIGGIVAAGAAVGAGLLIAAMVVVRQRQKKEAARIAAREMEAIAAEKYWAVSKGLKPLLSEVPVYPSVSHTASIMPYYAQNGARRKAWV